MKNHKSAKFLDQLDALILIEEAMIPDQGEDSFFCAVHDDAAIVSVFDGCGGLGSRTYPGYRGHTGAYVASRLISGATHDWFHETHSLRWGSAEALLSSLNRYWAKAYRLGQRYTNSNLRIRGSMVRDLPTTCAIALAQAAQEGITLHIIWSGDSRVYLLDGNGLAQLTKDDVECADAFENLFEDGVLTNVLSSDGNYSLNYKSVHLETPGMIFAATDGCFGYIPSPMQFEYLLLDALAHSDSMEDFQARVKQGIQKATGDDFALGLMSFHYGTFEKMKASVSNRWKYMKNRYITPLESDHSSSAVQKMWKEYKGVYERYL